ncbi:MAG: Crp/Fnr family transcriptional regulator [Anaerofustis stercorihominis]|nr:Crp/Fnr family transcriptional regulator [Anaerofustis stercorihominis]
MEKYYDILKRSALFTGMSDNDINELTRYLDTYTKKYKKGEYVHYCGDNLDRCGIVLSGELQAQNVSYDGEVSISAVNYAGDVFGDLLMSSNSVTSPVDVVAVKDSEVLFIPFGRIMTDGGGEALYRLRMNLLGEISEKYFALRKKISYLSASTVREKIVLFLTDRQSVAGKRSFRINISRQQMADILGVNRSALSRELSRMMEEGLIYFDRDYFEILDKLV